MSEQILQQILDKLNKIELEQQFIKTEMQDMKSQMNSRFNTLDTKVSFLQEDVTKIKTSVERIELNQPEDVLGMLKTIHNKLEDRDNEMLAINRRLHRVEGIAEGLTKQ